MKYIIFLILITLVTSCKTVKPCPSCISQDKIPYITKSNTIKNPYYGKDYVIQHLDSLKN